ncbi:MAG: four helix bundle protein [Anaerolineales bacterium]
MSTVRRFEELIVWQKARALANTIHTLTLRLPFREDSRLRTQILDAAGSVMHNIAEGHDAGSDAEFIRFLKIARRSASEVQSELYLALDRGYISSAELKATYAQADEIKRLINGLIAYLRSPSNPSAYPVREAAAGYLAELPPDSPLLLPPLFYSSHNPDNPAD